MRFASKGMLFGSIMFASGLNAHGQPSPAFGSEIGSCLKCKCEHELAVGPHLAVDAAHVVVDALGIAHHHAVAAADAHVELGEPAGRAGLVPPDSERRG